MKLKKPRTCNNCCALDPVLTGLGFRCGLGYRIDNQTYVPLEPCPKPLTIKELINTTKKGG